MKIAVMNIFKESFKDFWEHKMDWVRVVTAPVIIWIFGAIFLGACMIFAGQEMTSMDVLMQGQQINVDIEKGMSGLEIVGNVVYYVLYVIALLSIMINSYRYAATRERGDKWWTLHLNMRFVKFTLYMILIGILAGIYAIIAAGIITGVHMLLESIALDIILGIIFVIGLFYGIFRVYLTLFLIANDQAQPLRRSWELLKGNVLRVLGLVLIISIAVGIIAAVVVGIAALITYLLALITPILGILGGIIVFISVAAMWLMSIAVGAKAVALVYKTFVKGKGL